MLNAVASPNPSRSIASSIACNVQYSCYRTLQEAMQTEIFQHVIRKGWVLSRCLLSPDLHSQGLRPKPAGYIWFMALLSAEEAAGCFTKVVPCYVLETLSKFY